MDSHQLLKMLNTGDLEAQHHFKTAFAEIVSLNIYFPNGEVEGLFGIVQSGDPQNRVKELEEELRGIFCITFAIFFLNNYRAIHNFRFRTYWNFLWEHPYFCT